MLITVYDIPERRRKAVERAYGDVKGTWSDLMTVQFTHHTIRSNDDGYIIIRAIVDGKGFVITPDGYSSIKIE